MSQVSIVGAFPTTFSLDSSCTAVSSEEVVGIDFATTCLPDDFNPATNAYYSPGTGCPAGYTAPERCTRSSGDSTTITCCPVRTKIDVTMACVTSAAELSSVWKEMLCTWSAGDDETVILVTTVSDGTTQVPAITMSGGDGINAYGLKMIYQAGDLSTSANSTSATTTRETSAAATASPADSGDDGSSGMSTGAKVAIGVVIPLVVIAILVVMFFWFRRRKQRYGAVNASAGDDAKDEPKELPPSNGISELYGTQQSPPSELAAPTIVSELPAEVPMKDSSPSSGYLSTTMSPSPALTDAAVSKGDTSSPAVSHYTPRS